MQRRATRIGILLLALTVTLIPASASAAIPTSAPAVAQAAATATDDQASAPVVVLLDLSGSMNEDDGTGLIKLTGAKKAVGNVVRSLAPTQPFGLWTYPGGNDSCSSGSFVSPPAPISDLNGTIATVDRLVADSGTPTGPALRSAADALLAAGSHTATLVLVSDGESNCGPDPCEVARELVGEGFDVTTGEAVDVTIHTVGFRVSDTGRDELSCVANATGGTYVDVTDSAQLDATLQQLTRATLKLTVGGVLDQFAGVPARISVTVTNLSLIAASDVQVLLELPPGTLGGLNPLVKLGIIPPAMAVERSFVLGTGADTLSSTGGASAPIAQTPFTVGAWAQNADRVTVSGEIRSQAVSTGGDMRSLLGPILREPLDGGHPIVIMGDSYSSGEGTFDYAKSPAGVSPGCHRSPQTYLAARLASDDVINLACSGAVSWDFYHPGRDGTPTQLAQLDAVQTPGAVVMTLGGNDIGFPDIVRQCILPVRAEKYETPVTGLPNVMFVPNGCDQNTEQIAGWQSAADSLRAWLAPVYRDVWKTLNAPSRVEQRGGAMAPVIVLGYPQVTHANRFGSCGRIPASAGLLGTFGAGEVRVANDLAARLNAAIKAAVADVRAAGYEVYFVPQTMDIALPNHTVCHGSASYINNVVGVGDPESIHPNVNGYLAETSAIIGWSRSVERVPPSSDATAERVGTSPWRLGGVSWTRQAVVDGQLFAGAPASLQLTGYAPGTPITVMIHSTPAVLGSFVADGEGSATATVGIPDAMALGQHEIVVFGTAPDGSYREERLPVSVVAPIPAGVILALIATALLLIAAIVLLIQYARSVRRGESPTRARSRRRPGRV